MNILKKFLYRISHFLLTIIRVLRKAICCRRKKDESLLPLTINQVDAELYKPPDSYQFHSQWEAWPKNENTSSIPTNNLKTDTKIESQNFSQEENADDFFKDMVPQIRKPKKLYIRKETEEREKFVPSNRLAMDPKAILSEPDLGIIDDSPSNWEDDENLESGWDPNQLIRETKRAEREKRLAEHQRRKQERESRRASKQNSANSINILYLADTKDKTKSS